MHRQCHFGNPAVTLRYSGQEVLANNDTWSKTMASLNLTQSVEIRGLRMHPNTSVGFS